MRVERTSGPRRSARTFSAEIAGFTVSKGLAALVALDNIDFFSIADFADTTAPHNEHIFVALVLVGFAFVGTRFVPTWEPQGELNPRPAAYQGAEPAG